MFADQNAVREFAIRGSNEMIERAQDQEKDALKRLIRKVEVPAVHVGTVGRELAELGEKRATTVAATAWKIFLDPTSATFADEVTKHAAESGLSPELVATQFAIQNAINRAAQELSHESTPAAGSALGYLKAAQDFFCLLARMQTGDV